MQSVASITSALRARRFEPISVITPSSIRTSAWRWLPTFESIVRTQPSRTRRRLKARLRPPPNNGPSTIGPSQPSSSLARFSDTTRAIQTFVVITRFFFPETISSAGHRRRVQVYARRVGDPRDDLRGIGDRLREERVKAGLSQRELARRL